jgi:GNAT superfamily N-acetyltransferase
VRELFGEHEIDDDPTRVDRDVVWAYLSTTAYWGRDRSRADVEAQIDRAWRVVGAYEIASGQMVGFARADCDGIGPAFLADVFVHDAVRGRELGKQIVRLMIDGGPGAHLRWMLHARDAHGLYAQFGFAQPDETYMERPGRRP